ncbi:MAG: zinc ribbon domain-containing protein [Thermoproteota archaeon]|nr:zinc ribbon domain-containing protein [Thermoproteota archaeon]
MVFCKHCGKDFPLEDITFCPSCGKPQQLGASNTLVTTQTKNHGTAVLIALIAGLFGFEGIGHIYLGRIGKGIGLLLIGWVLSASAFLFALGGIFVASIILGIGVFVFWIWQAYDANKQAKYYNESLLQNGKAPW